MTGLCTYASAWNSPVRKVTIAIMFRSQLMANMCATAILCSSGGLLAQTIFKEIDAAGRTTFTDRPAAGLGVPRETLPDQERGMASPPRIAGGTRTDVAEALASNSRMTSMYAADIDFNEATRRLWQARANRQEGVEPGPVSGPTIRAQ
jgi:hypothetical protein